MHSIGGENFVFATKYSTVYMKCLRCNPLYMYDADIDHNALCNNSLECSIDMVRGDVKTK